MFIKVKCKKCNKEFNRKSYQQEKVIFYYCSKCVEEAMKKEKKKVSDYE